MVSEPVAVPESKWKVRHSTTVLACLLIALMTLVCCYFPPHFLEACRIPELIFWHIPSTAYVKVAPEAKSEISKPCVGSINKEDVAPQAAEWGMMDALAKRPSVKVSQSTNFSFI